MRPGDTGIGGTVHASEGLDEAVQNYIDAIAPEHRPLFDRLHHLILELYPEATVTLSYKMPTYKVGRGRLHIGSWKHGVSLYGWKQDGADAFMAHHPELRTSKGTIQLRPEDSAGLSDAELGELVHSALGPR
jgi:uncharacterized protein YdhG (YjbR/CyaY superfamily)